MDSTPSRTLPSIRPPARRLALAAASDLAAAALNRPASELIHIAPHFPLYILVAIGQDECS